MFVGCKERGRLCSLVLSSSETQGVQTHWAWVEECPESLRRLWKDSADDDGIVIQDVGWHLVCSEAYRGRE